MSREYVVVFVFVLAAVIVMLAAWWYARRVKQSLAEPSSIGQGARAVIELTPTSCEQLRAASSEPILMKQAEEGLRVQIEQRPMLPMMAFTGSPVGAALAEAAAAVAQLYGAKWVVLVGASKDDRVKVQRLA